MQNVIFGASMVGEKFLFYHYNEIEIKCFFDNYRYGEIWKYEIVKPFYSKNYFIIVATDRYLEVRKQLIELGYKEFENFIPYQLYKKKMAVMHGNCHMYAIKQYMAASVDFNQEYGFYPFPLIYEIPREFDYRDVLYHCDLFLHQSIRKRNCYGEEYSSDNLLQYVSDKCQVVSVPNLYGMPKCFFPQMDMSKREEYQGGFQFIAGHDKNIQKWIEEKVSLQKIKDLIKNRGGVYKKKDILILWDEFKNKLITREKEWDIKISDFIFENFREEKLFYDTNHISDFLVRELASRILKFIGYTENPNYNGFSLDQWETYIYKDVVDALGLQFNQNEMRRGRPETLLDHGVICGEEYIENLYGWEMFYRTI